MDDATPHVDLPDRLWLPCHLHRTNGRRVRQPDPRLSAGGLLGRRALRVLRALPGTLVRDQSQAGSGRLLARDRAVALPGKPSGRLGLGLLLALLRAVGHPPHPGVHVAHQQPERDGQHEEGDEAPDAGRDRPCWRAVHEGVLSRPS